MANTASDNYTVPEATTFYIPSADTDSFNRSLHITAALQALEDHDHSTGKGASVSVGSISATNALTVTTETDAASVQVGVFQGDRATYATNDEAYTSFKLSNSAGEQTELGRITWVATDITNGSEDGRLDFGVMTAGIQADELVLTGQVSGEATGVGGLYPTVNNALILGSSSGNLAWGGLLVGNGGYVNFNAGDVTLTHSLNTLTLAGGLLSVDDTTESTSTVTGSIHTDGGLGVAKDIYAGDDIFFTSGAVLNFNSSDVTLTHSAGALTIGDGGLVVGSPTGGLKGDGTINATAVYDDNSILSDYVFSMDYKLPSIKEMTNFFKKHLHLPTIPGRKEWEENGKFSLGKIATHLWETVEVQARYISELDNRVITLEKAIAQYR